METNPTDTERLDALEKLLTHCPHAELYYNNDSDTEDHTADGVTLPVGFRLLVEGCETTDFQAPTLREVLDMEIAHQAKNPLEDEE